MFAVEVRDHIMIAHSLPRPVFGPAQGMHGATFTVDAAFFTRELDDDGLAIDMGLAMTTLNDILKPLNYKNLDELPQFTGKVTTTEYLAKYIFDQLAAANFPRVVKIRVTLHESHTARGWYEGEL